jgi:hypothetical protein
MAQRTDQVEATLNLCCGGKKCPEIQHESSGDFVISDSDQLIHLQLRLTEQQARMLVDWLALRLTR